MSLKIYNLKGFDKFLQLIKENTIFVNFYFREIVDGNNETRIDNHGIAFKIKNDDVWKLFERIKI